MKTPQCFALILAATITLGGVSASYAASTKAAASERPVRNRLLTHAKEKLALTDEQISQIKGVLKADKENLTTLFSRLREARSGVRDAIRAADANESSVRAASAKVAAVEADLAVERLKLFGKISPILTPEQREQLQELQTRLDDFVEGLIQRRGKKLAE
jgi:Spy/CpxP family protein refolding chaperone